VYEQNICVESRSDNLAAEESAGAARLAELGEARTAIAARTQATFQRARETGAVTSVGENLASGDLLAIELRSTRLSQELALARQRLNTLIGLPPRADVPVRATRPGEVPALPAADPDALVELGLDHRPDLAELRASYQAAEQDVRYEIARQWPELSIGTGIFIVPQLFSHGNEPAIRAALEERARLGRELEAHVHQVRGEIHAAWTSYEQAQRVVEFLGRQALPNAEEGLRLTSEAL
jgi:outer membrane protein TolC